MLPTFHHKSTLSAERLPALASSLTPAEKSRLFNKSFSKATPYNDARAKPADSYHQSGE